MLVKFSLSQHNHNKLTDLLYFFCSLNRITYVSYDEGNLFFFLSWTSWFDGIKLFWNGNCMIFMSISKIIVFPDFPGFIQLMGFPWLVEIVILFLLFF